ncbi:hypothetical protein [Nevskia soli]|uniref:hypothetical protein n=1 Tax=Nevskia soli TaxID=418856 RepID=UPI0004A6C037|nr:hypothetical protein [Nevskia soli]
MQFNPTSAAPAYAEKSTDELIQIAFLEQDYLSEAKRLAEEELTNRGLKITPDDIERTRLRMEEVKRQALEYSIRHLESDEDMPSWRRRVRSRLAPYRQVIALIAFALIVVAMLNSFLGWGLMNLSGRKSEGIAILVGLLCMVFIGSSKEDALEQAKAKSSR